MKKINFSFTLGVAWIVLFVGLAIGRVGTATPVPGINTSWALPLEVGLMLIPLFIFGYFAGKDVAKNEKEEDQPGPEPGGDPK